MKRFLIYTVLALVSISGFSTESEKWIKDAVEQIDFLYERNQKIEQGEINQKKWYIYFIGSDQPTLNQYLVGIENTKNKTFSSGYLDNLNVLLTQINQQEGVAMYVAVSDYNDPITVPLLPKGSSIEEKIASLKEILNENSEGYVATTGDYAKIDIENGLKDYENFKKFFFEKSEEILQNSVLSKVGAETDKRILMPFSVYHDITVDKLKKRFYTITIRSTKADEEADLAVKEMRPLLTDLKGKSGSEKKIESYVLAYLNHYSGNQVTITANAIKTTIKKDSELYQRSYSAGNASLDTDWNTTSQLLDYSGMLTQSDKDQIFEQIDFSRTLFNNMKMYVVLTDANTSSTILDNLNNLKPKNDQYYIWTHLAEDGTISINNIVPQGFDKQIAWATAHWTKVMWANLELNLGKGTVAHLKANLAISNLLLTYASNILALGMVPEKYWNPLWINPKTGKNEYPQYMPYVAKAFNASMGDFGSVLNTEMAQMQFAFKTGIWNGVIDEVKGLVDLGKMATDYFLKPDEAKKMDDGFSHLTVGAIWDSFKGAHGFTEGQETNEFKLSHQLGKDVVFVASLFIGVGEVAAIAKGGKMASVGTKLAGNMSKLSKALTSGAIQLIKKLPNNIGDVLRKLPDNIVREVQKVGAKSYLILKLNTTKIAKVSDDAVFSEMKVLQDGAIVKLTDQSDAIFRDAKYIDEIGEKTVDLTIVENGGEIGIKIGDDLAETVYKNVEIKTIPPGGKYPDDFVDVKISEITPMHDVPRATVPKGVEDAEKLLREDGFKVAEPTLVNPVKVVELPDGTKIIMDGHHRVKAMQNLQEAHVPVNYKTYDDLVASVNSGASTELIADVYYLLTIGKKTGKYKGNWFPDHPSLTSVRKQELINNADEFIRKDFPDLATGLSQAQFTELLTSVKSKLDNFVSDSWFDNIGEGLLIKLDDLPNDVIAKLGKDLEVQDFAKAIKENGDLLDGWRLLDDANVSAVLKRDPIRLGHVDNYLKKNPSTENVIKQGLDDVGDYKEEFLNGIKNATDDLSGVNGRSALPDEISNSVTRIKQHRTDINKPHGKNYGYIEGDVNGSAVDNKIWSSGEAKPDVEPQIFDAIEVEGSSGHSWLRNTDSEYKMLNQLADDLGGVKGQTYPNVNGNLKIVSENPYCASCQGVIEQFNEMYPNINLILVDGVR